MVATSQLGGSMKRFISLITVTAILTACPPVVIVPTPDGGFTIQPQGARADPGQAIKFIVQMAQGAPPPITWSVTGGGSIDANGNFIAPTCATTLPATITITATALSTTATQIVTVADKVTAITISPLTTTLAPGATQQFTATVKSVCFPAGMVQGVKILRPKDGGAPQIVEPPVGSTIPAIAAVTKSSKKK